MRALKRKVAFAVIAAFTGVSILASAQAQQKKPASKPPPAPASKLPPKPPPLKPDSDDARDGGVAAKDEKAPAASSKDAGAGGGAVESKTLDGGQRVFRFGEVEVEGRLKSPQIVYFLRRVRAEFAAGDLGHRTFMRELSETRNEPGF